MFDFGFDMYSMCFKVFGIGFMYFLYCLVVFFELEKYLVIRYVIFMCSELNFDKNKFFYWFNLCVCFFVI